MILYGCETWTIVTKKRKKLESFEIRGYRRILKINRIDMATNKEVLEKISEESCYEKV